MDLSERQKDGPDIQRVGNSWKWLGTGNSPGNPCEDDRCTSKSFGLVILQGSNCDTSGGGESVKKNIGHRSCVLRFSARVNFYVGFPHANFLFKHIKVLLG